MDDSAALLSDSSALVNRFLIFSKPSTSDGEPAGVLLIMGKRDQSKFETNTKFEFSNVRNQKATDEHEPLQKKAVYICGYYQGS